jgi:ADP-heptose:LPS heptosyltransferase
VIYHLSLLSFGDNLISLSLLAKLRSHSDVTIVGTTLTRRIARFVPSVDIPIRVILDDVPSFYDVRKRGIAAAFRDTLIVRRALRRETTDGNGLIFEKQDWRQRLLTGGTQTRSWAPARQRNVYEDRRDVLNTVFGEDIVLDRSPTLRAVPATVTINPGSRLRSKALSAAVVANIISYLRARSIEVRLIDPERQHAALRQTVSSYHTGTTLEEAVALVESSDLYIGADSLLVHFAYHCQRPVLVLYNATNLYFAPPGVEEQGSYLTFVARMSRRELWSALDARLTSSVTHVLHGD